MNTNLVLDIFLFDSTYLKVKKASIVEIKHIKITDSQLKRPKYLKAIKTGQCHKQSEYEISPKNCINLFFRNLNSKSQVSMKKVARVGIKAYAEGHKKLSFNKILQQRMVT